MRIGDWIIAQLGSLSPFRYVAQRCGHPTKRTGKVWAFGHSTNTRMPMNEHDSVDWCLNCIGKMAILCGCGKPIFIGDPVVEYTAKDGRKIIGCMDCADTIADQAGFWQPDETGKGHVHRIQTVYEALMGSKKS